MTNELSFQNGVLTIIRGSISTNKTGLPRNIRTSKSGKFVSTITHKGKALRIGSYETLEEAIAARDLAESAKEIRIIKQ